MTAVLQTTCPRCRSALRVPTAQADKPLRCPRCTAVMRLRQPARNPDTPPSDPQPRKRWRATVGVALVALLLIIGAMAASWAFLRPSATAASTEADRETPPEEPVFVSADQPAKSDEFTYARDIQPIIKQYCLRCHSSEKPKGGVILDREKDDAAILKNLALWEKVGDNLRSGEMPPATAKKPTAAEMERLNRWLDAVVFKTDCTGSKDPGRVTIRRLNRVEYNNTIRDLVGVNFEPAKDFPADDVGYGFDNIGDVLTMPPLLMEKYLDAAEKIVEEAFKKPELRAKLHPLAPKEKGAMYQNLRQFASKAWRRPATDDETKRLTRFLQLAREQGDAPEVGAKLAFQAVLISPHFLFRVELDRFGKEAAPIGEYELASRLSYFLWSTMPDEELFKLAEKKELTAKLDVQVKRMLRDPKAQALAEHFAGQWLNIRNLGGATPDPKRFPTFNNALGQAMLRETEAFFLHVVKEDRPILDFLDSDYTFANERLAKHYGLKGVKGDEFRKVSLKGTPRGGVLTQASVLTVTSNPTRTSPVKRGKWILENILGTPPPPPPPEVDELPEEGELKGTLRQQMEQHRVNPNCATCHQRMDPLGFGFENFDGVGAWRTREGKHAIDASGVLPDGSKFNGPAELRKVLMSKKEQFARCFIDKLMTYGLGRGMERADRCYIDEIAKRSARDDYRFTALVLDIVKSDPFLKRRAKTQKK